MGRRRYRSVINKLIVAVEMAFTEQNPESGIEDEVLDSGESIVDPFDPTKINVVREPMTVFQALRKISIDEIKLDPEFQRNLVWDTTRQSRLIESILLKIPLPAFYLDAVQPDQWAVVDGLQRLSTLYAFCNERTLALRGLEFLGPQFENFTFDMLPRSSQRDIEETQLTLYIIRPETPPNVKFTIFYRINTGGMVLTAQEIRHATFPGRAPKFLKELAASHEFQRATDFSVNPKRMGDRECVLRHLAFRLTKFTDYRKPDLNDFLGSAMSSINRASDVEVEVLEQDFVRAMDLCFGIFGPYAFRKFNRRTGSRAPVNKALFETWSTAVLEFDGMILLARSEWILGALERALEDDPEYVKSLSQATGGINPVITRFSKTYQIIQEALS